MEHNYRNEKAAVDLQPMPSPGLGDRLRRLIAGIPPSHVMRIGILIGNLMYVLDAPHRRLIRCNLQFVFPEWTRDRIRAFSRRNFQHYALTFLENLQAAFMSGEEICARFRVTGEEHLSRVLARGKGAIIISAHLGNFETALQYPVCCMQHPLTGVAKKLRYRLADQWLHRLRTRFGNILIYKKEALPKMINTLRRGGLLGVLVDQSRYKLAFDVAFWGRKATMTYAPALLARRCKSPVLPIFCLREADGRLAIRIEPPLDLQRTRDPHTDLQINTQKIADVVEHAIRRCPEQWFWYLKHFKKHYPHLYAAHLTGRQRRKLYRNQPAG
jgi:Kdo2-lipid IVA lauroyltransferase/acyltransferase